MKKIAVIGTGNMGKAIAASFAEQGFTVFLGSREAERAQQLAAALHPSVQGVSNTVAAHQGGIVFLAIPFQQNNSTINELQGALQGKIVVDISNPLNATYDGLTTPPDTSALEIIASQLPNSRLIGAFKNTFAGVFASPLLGEGEKSQVFVLGNDEAAKQEVIGLINTLPFTALDAGALHTARTIEQMTVLLIGLSTKHQYNWRAGYKVLS